MSIVKEQSRQIITKYAQKFHVFSPCFLSTENVIVDFHSIRTLLPSKIFVAITLLGLLRLALGFGVSNIYMHDITTLVGTGLQHSHRLRYYRGAKNAETCSSINLFVS